MLERFIEWALSVPFMEYVLLIVGFVMLIKGADFFVDGSSSIAKLFKVPSIIIGLTVVALGTSLPEAAVSVTSAIQGANSIAVSNVVGSNMFNLLVVLGASALLCPVKAQESTVKLDIPTSILAAVVLLASCILGKNVIVPYVKTNNFFKLMFDGHLSFTIGRIAGAVLLVLFVAYIVWQVLAALKARKNGDVSDDGDDEGKKLSLPVSIVLIVVGAVAIMLGGEFVVGGAKEIARTFGMSDTLIGLTIVALGTSLPELVTSMVAAKKGESDLALGNVIGSNIFNIFFVLGASAVISPMTVDELVIYDLAILILVSAVTWIFAATGRKISRWQGGTLVGMYIAYFVYILLR